MWRKLLVTLGILCFLSVAKAQADDVYAYCPLGEGYVFLYDSVSGFQVIANLKCGAKLTVVDASDKDRTRVRTADGKEGYVVKSSITVPPPSAQRQPGSSPTTSTQQPQLPPPPTPVSQPQAQPQPKPQPEPQAQPQPPSQPEAPAPASQPEPQPQLEVRSEPLTPEPTPEEQPKPEAKSKPKPKSKSESEPKAARQSQSRVQQPGQPEPAATGFTPFSTLGYEQNVPRLEAYGGLGYLNAGTSALASRQNVLGFDGSVAVHINKWVAGEGDFSGYYKTIQVLNVGTFPFHDYLMMGGPRFNIRRAFFHGLVGIDRLAGNWNFYTFNGSTPRNVLAGAGGGGVQWNVTRKLALRTSADYVLSRFGMLTQSNVRLTLGIVFQEGSVRSE